MFLGSSPRRFRGCVAGWSSLVARRAHNPEVVGSNPTPAMKDGEDGEDGEDGAWLRIRKASEHRSHLSVLSAISVLSVLCNRAVSSVG